MKIVVNRCKSKLSLLRPPVFLAKFWIFHLESLTVFTRSFLHPKKPDVFCFSTQWHCITIIIAGKAYEDKCVARVPSSGGNAGERYRWTHWTHHLSRGSPGLPPSPDLPLPSLLLQSHPLPSTPSRSNCRICRKEKKLFEVGVKPARAASGLWGKKMPAW